MRLFPRVSALTAAFVVITLVGCGVSTPSAVPSPPHVQVDQRIHPSSAATDSSKASPARSARPSASPSPSPSPATGLPDGFASFAALRSTMGPVLARATAIPVWLPVSTLRGQLNVDYVGSASGYTISVYGGPPLPVNGPGVAAGNAEFVLTVRGAQTEAGLNLQETYGPLSPWTPNASQGEIALPHGLVGTTFTSGAGASTVSGIGWQEDGWTFVLTPTLSQNQLESLAVDVANQNWDMTLPQFEPASPYSEGGVPAPLTPGTVAFGVGPDAPSIAVFQEDGTWYAVMANGWSAARWAAEMAPIP